MVAPERHTLLPASLAAGVTLAASAPSFAQNPPAFTAAQSRQQMDLCWGAWDLDDAGEIGRAGAVT